jgi:hypothetical protein
MKTKRFDILDQVAYIPLHADGNIAHPDVEYGFVTSKRRTDGSYVVRYWSKTTPKELRTKASGEIMDEENLVHHVSHTAKEVQNAYDQYVFIGKEVPNVL